MAIEEKVDDKNKSVKNNTKKTGKKKSSNVNKVIIVIIFILGAIALIFTLFNQNYNMSPISICKLPLIDTVVYSSDGEQHTFKTNVSFGIDKNLVNGYDEQEMYNLTKTTIESLDYDRLNAPDGTEYLKSSIRTVVIEQQPELVNENFDIYISGYDTGLINGFLPGMIEDSSYTGGNRDDKIMEIFGN